HPGRDGRHRAHPVAGVRPLHLQCLGTRCRFQRSVLDRRPFLSGGFMNLRRFSAVIAALTATTLVVAACSGGTNAASGGGNSTTLNVASVDQGSIEDVVKAFEAANPGVKVNLTTAAADQFQQQIRTQLSSGTAPDVFTVWPGNGNPGATYVLGKPGYLMDLTDQSW